jgi:hypothetical protein
MLFIGGLVAQQIPVSTNIEKGFIRFKASLSYGQGYGAVRIALLDIRYDLHDPAVAIIAVLPALQDECPETKLISGFTAFQNILLA